MSKKDLVKYSLMRYTLLHLEKNYPTNKIINNHIDEISSVDLADFSDYKTSKNKGYR